MRYRRARIDGGTYFFTVNLAERHRLLLVEYVTVLREVVTDVKQRLRSTSTPSWCCRITYMQCGPCAAG